MLRLARLCLAVACALGLALLLNLALASSAAAEPLAHPLALGRPAAPALTAADTFSATASLTVSAETLTAGNLLTVTAQVVTTGTCGFSIYDVTLRQAEAKFIYIDPADNVIGPPGENPAIWQLAARQSGVTTFTVEFYGETNCSGVWNWTAVRSQPQPVTVTGFHIGLPLVSKNAGSLPVTNLGSLGGDSIAVALNNRGEVAGSSTTSTVQHAFVWRNLAGARFHTVDDLREQGQVVGLGSVGSGRQWEAAGE